MSKKAKLDILEINIQQKIDETTLPFSELENQEEAVRVESLTKQNKISKIKACLRGYLLRIILTPVIVIVSISGYFIWHNWGSARTVSIDSPQHILSVVNHSAKDKIVSLEGFVVDRKTDKGDIKIIFCGTGIEIDKPELVKDIGDRVDVREVVYNVLKRNSTEDGLSLEKRNLQKMEIQRNLNSLLGENTVVNVYFTSYE